MRVLRVEADGAAKRLDGLVHLLGDAVDSGTSLAFFPPLGAEDATRYWLRVISDIADGRRILIVAEDENGLQGTIQLGLVQTPNQPHRAEVSELMVHPQARQQGIGRTLMDRVEVEAADAGRSLLTFDTRSGDFAEALCESLGYTRAGTIPGFAITSDGDFTDTSFFWKRIEPANS